MVAVLHHKIGITSQTFLSGLRDVVEIRHILHGLLKSFVFAFMIGAVSCHQGLTTIGGPRGIGRSVTKAVVNSIVLVLILDYYLTKLLLTLDYD